MSWKRKKEEKARKGRDTMSRSRRKRIRKQKQRDAQREALNHGN
jgi:hypothetical protein